MNQVFHFIKLAIAVCAGVAAVVLAIIGHPMALTAGVISLAWSMMPE